MASNTSYRPVGIEEDMRHNSPNRRRFYDDDESQSKDRNQNRCFSPHVNHINRVNGNGRCPRFPLNESENDNENRDGDEVDGFLGFPKKQGRGMVGVCCFSLIILVIGVVFLLGVCLGFYVRETQQNKVDFDDLCGAPERPTVDYGVLGGYHETLMYYIRGEEIRKFVDEFGTDDPVTGSGLERRLEEAVLQEFNANKLDSIHVEEHEILVTYPDPDKPNRLVVLHATNGTVVETFEFVGIPPPKDSGNAATDSGNQTSDGSKARAKRDNHEKDDEYLEKWWRHPHVSFSPPGMTKAPLVYGHYGLVSDFEIMESLGMSVSGKTVLLSLGKTSVADKVMEAERRGAVSVLLYWDVDDHFREKGSRVDPEHVPYVSATTYIEDQPSLWTPSIPCQTISTYQAHSLITLMDADLKPATADGGSDSSNTKNTFKESVLVELHVNNKYRKQMIRNIITTIQGIEEQEHYTIVGAPRSSLPFSPFQDVVVSTSILTQLVRSINYLHNLHFWKPRRGIKVISWAGAEFSNAGALMHIMKLQHVLANRAVAYIDVGHLFSGNETIAAQASSTLQQLIKEVAFDIRDPRDEGETIQSHWLQQPKRSNSGGMYRPVSGFGTDNTLFPFLHLLGIPTVRAHFQGKRHIDPQTDRMTLQSYSYAHHYKFHIAMCRVLVMVILNLGDTEVLPISLESVAREFDSTMWQTSAVVEGCTDDEASLEHLVSLSENFKKTAKAFEERARDFVKRNDTKGVSIMNNIKMQMERVFVTRHHGTSHHILHPTNPDGSLQHVTHLCELFAMSHSLHPLVKLGETLERIITEANLMLKIGA